MMTSFYESTMPIILAALGRLHNILWAAEEQAIKKQMDPTTLLAARVFPDYLPVYGQVQIICDAASICGAKLVGIAPLKLPLTERTFAGLRLRIKLTSDYLKMIPSEQVNQNEDRMIVIKNMWTCPAYHYVHTLVMKKMHFHISVVFMTFRSQEIYLKKRYYFGHYDRAFEKNKYYTKISETTGVTLGNMEEMEGLEDTEHVDASED